LEEEDLALALVQVLPLQLPAACSAVPAATLQANQLAVSLVAARLLLLLLRLEVVACLVAKPAVLSLKPQRLLLLRHQLQALVYLAALLLAHLDRLCSETSLVVTQPRLLPSL
jgi:hypothetical protein